MTLKQTALYQQHLDANAKMIDFGGWNMPIHYGSQIDEHHVVRQTAGIFDVSHMLVVDIIGEQAKAYLQYLLANNIESLQTAGKALYSCMLNEQGGVIDDLIVYYLDKQNYRLVVNAGTQEKDVAWMQKQAENFKVTIEPRNNLAMVAIQGPQAIAKTLAVLSPELAEKAKSLIVFSAISSQDWFIGRTGYTGEDGFEIMLPAEEAAELWKKCLAVDIKPCGLGARDTLRLEAGMNLYGHDMDEQTSPLAAGLAWTIGWKPETRNFIGRKALETQTELPLFVGVLLVGRGVFRDGLSLFAAGTEQKIGEISSGGFSPTLKRTIALARINKDYSEVEVEIRGKKQAVEIIKPRFVRHGKSLL